MRRSLITFPLLVFVGCPVEWRCIATEPRPAPSLRQVNEELVAGLKQCGYLSNGKMGAISPISLAPERASSSVNSCVRTCLHGLRTDCEALGEMVCLAKTPSELADCIQDCVHHGCPGNGMHMCGSPLVACGLDRALADGQPATSSAPFTCLDGSGAIERERVCDLVPDCPDASDEAAGQQCVHLRCPSEAAIDPDEP